MATVDAPRMTVEEFLALPDDGVRRMLIDGEVREIGMTIRRWRHGDIQANIAYLLKAWLLTRPRPRGRVMDGDVGFRLATGTLVGTNIAYVSPELAAATPESQAVFLGAPVLAAEVLSPSDKQEDVDDKVAAYLDAGVHHVWVVQPRFRTVTAYRPDSEQRLYTIRDDIDAEPHLPGFRAAVATIFED
ncbi:MAG TPA: Uma2 family endonuclease [Isosphaeraceae bacterium]